MCPPGVDQTERGPQYWHILAPRRQKIYRLSKDRNSYGSNSPREILFNDELSWNAWSKLAMPASPLRTQATQSTRRRKRTHTLSRLESLPTELIELILEDPLLEKSDIIALGLTSETLWEHALQHIEKDCSRTQPSMAGIELACTGTYLTDLPESFEKDGLAKSTVEIHPFGYMCEARKINRGATSKYQTVNDGPEDLWKDAWKPELILTAAISERLAGAMTMELMSRCSGLRGSSPNAPWVLRNLTTQEYVRCRPGPGLTDRRGYIDHPNGFKVRLDDALLLRICWTKVSPWTDKEGLGIYRGSWAGHCFDIVPLDQAGIGKGWKDSTNEILEQAMTVAKKLFNERKIPRGIESLTRACVLSASPPPRKKPRFRV